MIYRFPGNLSNPLLDLHVLYQVAKTKFLLLSFNFHRLITNILVYKLTYNFRLNALKRNLCTRVYEIFVNEKFKPIHNAICEYFRSEYYDNSVIKASVVNKFN